MLMRGDFDLNSVQRYTGSLEEVFKQTILDQEVIFRKQVHDLHRLYSMQKTLMKDLACKEFDRYNSWKASSQSSLIPLINPTRHEPLAKDTRFPSNPMQAAGSNLPISQEMSEGHQGIYYRLQQRPLDLQLPADQYISHGDDDPMELKLSLSLGEDNRRKQGAKRAWFDKKTHSYSITVIDLEESTERISNCSQTVVIDLEEESTERIPIGDAKHTPTLGCAAAAIACFGGKHEAQVSVLPDPIISGCVKKNPSHEIAESSCLVDDTGCCEEKNSFNQGFKEFHDDITCNNLSTNKQQIIPHQGGPVDLNKVLFDDSSCYLNDPSVAYPSTASSSDGFSRQVGRVQGGFSPTTTWKEEINNCLNEISDVWQEDDLALMNSNNKNQGTQIWARNCKLEGISISEVNLTESVLRSSIDLCEGLGSPSSDPKNEKDELKSFQDGLLHVSNHTCVASRQVSCEKSEVEDTVVLCFDDSQDTVHDECGNKSPASCKSRCISDDDSSSVKTMQSGTDFGNSNIPSFDQFSRTCIGSQVTESSELKHECNNKKEESAEVDVMIQSAAESLIHFSSYNSASHQDCSTKAGSNEMENEEREQPQYSTDSYELIALKLTESNEDDYCVSSKPFEVNDSENKDFGFKLRRGRRLKDFQRDILPGLASLSRHEIREDINILEGVLRSREYRKIRGRKAAGESWCVPVRSKRSRLSYGRRHFS